MEIAAAKNLPKLNNCKLIDELDSMPLTLDYQICKKYKEYFRDHIKGIKKMHDGLKKQSIDSLKYFFNFFVQQYFIK